MATCVQQHSMLLSHTAGLMVFTWTLALVVRLPVQQQMPIRPKDAELPGYRHTAACQQEPDQQQQHTHE
jgi:hypothetical protein